MVPSQKGGDAPRDLLHGRIHVREDETGTGHTMSGTSIDSRLGTFVLSLEGAPEWTPMPCWHRHRTTELGIVLLRVDAVELGDDHVARLESVLDDLVRMDREALENARRHQPASLFVGRVSLASISLWPGEHGDITFTYRMEQHPDLILVVEFHQGGVLSQDVRQI